MKSRLNPCLALLLLITTSAWGNSAQATKAMVATVNPLATDAAVRVLQNGGNAIDAAVEAALALGVVDGYNSGIGGGCFMLVRLSDGTVLALDGREMAPAAATRDMFIRHGHADTNLSQTGALASGIPGSLAVYDYILHRAGTRTLADLLRPAADMAERGFPITKTYATHTTDVAADLKRYPATRDIFLHADGAPYKQGEILKQPDLAHSYRAIADHGIAWFYHGEFAQATEDWMKENGGIIRAGDFAHYEMKLRDPLITHYRSYTILGFPPPSSGGVHVAEILNILDHFDLQALHQHDPADFITVVAESMQLAFADRAYWLGDPDFVHVPVSLISTAYAGVLAKQISTTHAIPVLTHGNPPDPEEFFGQHTTHIAAADADGNFVAITATVNTAFGSKVVIPHTGIILNNQMDDFSIEPGVANHFKLVGAAANAVAPGKRPLSSMSPTIVLQNNKPILTVGAAGGPRIITQVVLAIINYLDLHQTLEQSLASPRFHHQWSPDVLSVESTMPKAVLDSLRQRGFKIDLTKIVGATQAIGVDGGTHTLTGTSEPRLSGKVAGIN